MKNLVNFFLVFFLTITNITHLHSQVEATSPASAQVESALTLMREAGTEIDFGILSATTPGDIILDPRGSSSNENTGTDTGVARFNLGGADIPVTVTYDMSVVLTSGAATMIMTPIVVGGTTLGIQGTALEIQNANHITPESGEFYFWIGGIIPKLTNQILGEYLGEFKINVEYQ